MIMGFCPSNELLIIVETVRNLGHYRTFVTQIPGLMSGYWLAVAGGGSLSLQVRGGGGAKQEKFIAMFVCFLDDNCDKWTAAGTWNTWDTGTLTGRKNIKLYLGMNWN